jgi:hypothetical protein
MEFVEDLIPDEMRKHSDFGGERCKNEMEQKEIIQENMNVNNIDDRWNMIGEVVNKYGTKDEKLAWALCRGDAAEWKLKK